MLDMHFHVNLRPSYDVTDHYKSVDKIPWCYHPNKSSLAELLNSVTIKCQDFTKEIWNFCEFFTLAGVRNQTNMIY